MTKQVRDWQDGETMKVVVNKSLDHMFMDISLKPGTELLVDKEVTPRGMIQIISPEEYAEIYVSLDDVDLVKEASHE